MSVGLNATTTRHGSPRRSVTSLHRLPSSVNPRPLGVMLTFPIVIGIAVLLVAVTRIELCVPGCRSPNCTGVGFTCSREVVDGGEVVDEVGLDPPPLEATSAASAPEAA